MDRKVYILLRILQNLTDLLFILIIAYGNYSTSKFYIIFPTDI